MCNRQSRTMLAKLSLLSRFGRSFRDIYILIELEGFELRGRDDIVAAIGVMHLAGDRARLVGQQVERRAADFIQVRSALERRMRFLIVEDRTGVGNGGAGKSAHGTG